MNWGMTLEQRQAHARMLNFYRAAGRVTEHFEMFPSRQVRESNKVKAKAAEARRKRKIEIPVYLSEHRKRFEA